MLKLYQDHFSKQDSWQVCSTGPHHVHNGGRLPVSECCHELQKHGQGRSTIIRSTFDRQILLSYMQKYLEVILQTQLQMNLHHRPSFQLIQHMNERSSETGIFLTYSTPSCYLNALRQNKDLVRNIVKTTLVSFALLYRLTINLLGWCCWHQFALRFTQLNRMISSLTPLACILIGLDISRQGPQLRLSLSLAFAWPSWQLNLALGI